MGRNKGLSLGRSVAGGGVGADTRNCQFPSERTLGEAGSPVADWQREEAGSEDHSRFRANDEFAIRESKKPRQPSQRQRAVVQNLAWCN